MNKNYFNLLLKKLDKLDESRFKTDLNAWSNGPIRSLEVKFPPYSEIRIVCEDDGLKIIMMDRVTRVDSFIAFPLKTSWLSLSWYKWRVLVRKLERTHKNEQIREKLKQEAHMQLKKLQNAQDVEHIMIVIFPEIMENDLLGDDDDK